jgi:hypothetical protein
MDYDKLADNIKFNKSLNFYGYSYLQINGIGFKDDTALEKYLLNAKEAGITAVDTTFFGLSDFHDQFSGRDNDFNYMITILEKIQKINLKLSITVPIFETNKGQIKELLILLNKHLTTGNYEIHIFLQDFWGRGIFLEETRLNKQSYDDLDENIKKHINMKRYKTESDWLEINQWQNIENRNLRLTLNERTIDKIKNLSCDEIVDHLIRIDENYYAQIPAMEELAKKYGSKSSIKLYRERDLWWKYQRQFINDNNLDIEDINDERNNGSLRY